MSWYLENQNQPLNTHRLLPCELWGHWSKNGIPCDLQAPPVHNVLWKILESMWRFWLCMRKLCLCFQLQGRVSRLTGPLQSLEHWLSTTCSYCPRKPAISHPQYPPLFSTGTIKTKCRMLLQEWKCLLWEGHALTWRRHTEDKKGAGSPFLQTLLELALSYSLWVQAIQQLIQILLIVTEKPERQNMHQHQPVCLCGKTTPPSKWCTSIRGQGWQVTYIPTPWSKVKCFQ